MKQMIQATGIVLLSVALSGCATDVSHVDQKPAAISPANDGHAFLLLKAVKVHLDTGYTSILRANTSWRQIGSLNSDEVYSTQDQVVTVWAVPTFKGGRSYEAYIVVSGGSLVGFYLPVQKTFISISPPIQMQLRQNP